VGFAPPRDPDQLSHAMTLRVTDCHAVYDALRRAERCCSPRRTTGARRSAAFCETTMATWWRSASQQAPDRGI